MEIREIAILFTKHFRNWRKMLEKICSCSQSLRPAHLPNLMHSGWFSRISLCNHAVKHFFQNGTQMHCSVTHEIQNHRTHGYPWTPKSRLKTDELIRHWHTEKAISCNVAPSKTQNFFARVGLFGRHYIYTIPTQMNNQMSTGLTLQVSKSSINLFYSKFIYVTQCA